MYPRCKHTVAALGCPICRIDLLRQKNLARSDCVHLGPWTGATAKTTDAKIEQDVHIMQCAKHEQCTETIQVPGIQSCADCSDKVLETLLLPDNPKGDKWAYGVTTVPSRRDNLLPRTLSSLRRAGFGEPRLFVDGDKDAISWEREFMLGVTARFPAVRTHCNWVLSAYELFARNPSADKYAIFQDDFVTYRNLRAYLDRCKYPERAYFNLYTFPSNQEIAKGNGWNRSNQLGKGAVALVFTKTGLLTLLGNRHMLERPLDQSRGHKAVDGGIVTAMRKEGWSEFVHNPSLVQHTGTVSSMGSRPQPQAASFRGEQFDAMELLKVAPETDNTLAIGATQ